MRTSQGEEKIIKILKLAGLKFVREKTFTDLKSGQFRFDFFIPSLNILIEFDGEQHFHQVKHFQKTRADFLKTQGHDRRKNSYALARGYKLYRIPYWEIDNINQFSDIINEKFLVKSRNHNDYLKK